MKRILSVLLCLSLLLGLLSAGAEEVAAAEEAFAIAAEEEPLQAEQEELSAPEEEFFALEEAFSPEELIPEEALEETLAVEETAVAEPEEEPEDALQVEESLELASSGTWGQLKWTLDNSGLLTISGNGPMNDFGRSSSEAWHTYKKSIRRVVIGDGVKRIGCYAFYDCDSIESVSIPDSVAAIGDFAFSCCSSMTSVVIPDSVTSFGIAVFETCYGLADVKLPSTLTEIPERMFMECAELRTVAIPDSVTKIGSQAFECCYFLTSLNIPHSVNEIGYEAFSQCTSLSSITLPDGIRDIDDNTFWYSSLREIVIPDSVMRIGASAFEGCYGLTSVTIPNSVITIEASAFSDCAALSNVSYQGTQEEWSRISIGDYNENLKEANIHFIEGPIIPGAVTGLTARPADTSSVRLTWNRIDGVTGYQLWRSDDHGDFKWIKNCTTSTVYNYCLEAGRYQYKVRSYTTHGSSRIYGAFSRPVTVYIPGKTTDLRIIWRGQNSVRLAWRSQPCVTGYQVFRALGSDGKFTWLKNVTDAEAINYALTPNTTYCYKVRAYVELENGKRAYGGFSDILFVYNQPKMYITVKSGAQPEISWTEVSGVTAYQIVIAEDGPGGDYVWWKNFPAGTTSAVLDGLKAGQLYSIKVRTFVEMPDGSRSYGLYSDPKTIRVR